MGFFGKIFKALKKTKDALKFKLDQLFKRTEIDDEFYDELEELLITSDVGVKTTLHIIEKMQDEVYERKANTIEQAREILNEIIVEILDVEDKVEFEYPLIITIVGVNGVGKTTTIGKMAKYFTNNKKSVMLVAGDTFRAAASAQLIEWGNRNKVKVVSQGEGADPSAVVFDGISSAKAKKTDVLIIDTAGRLHNKTNLMDELKKINRTKSTNWPEAKLLNLIVLDATTGQNALLQVEAFKDAIGIDGIVLTKLDGSAKGGVVLGIAHEIGLPIYFVGVGEGIDDLEVFDSREFAEGLMD